jgi:hypothetical protein
MANMSRNGSSHSLMGFSVHQPAIGSPLQFFPAMGSKQLDELIDAYVPGTISILDKRATVSLEFFDHTIQTGELFKFFLVHPSSNTASPASSSMQDSGYASSFNTSPVMSESQWAQASASSSQSKPRTSSKAAAADFSHIPGMKIMTKDGRDVTNTASRGCKTKEQRDHAHLMRIIKACPSCKRKKIRCDPAHKRADSTAAPSPEARVTKKTKKSASPPVPKMPAFETGMDLSLSSFDLIVPESMSLDDSFAAAAEPMDTWDQFIKYDDEEFVNVAPYNYDFFFDPAGYFSPTTSNSASVSPTQVLTPGSSDLSQAHTPAGASFVSNAEGHGGSSLVDLGDSQQPALPYLNPGGAEAGNNYVDFALYSPGSSYLDDDPALSKELAASPGLDYSDYQRSQRSSSRDRPLSRSSQRDQVSASPQDTVTLSGVYPTDVFSNHVSSWADASLATEPGDRGHKQQSSLGANHRVQAGIVSVVGPAHTTQSRVPTTTVSPPDRGQPLPPRESERAVPAGPRRDPRSLVTHEPIGIIQDAVTIAHPTTVWSITEHLGRSQLIFLQTAVLPTTERSTSTPGNYWSPVEQDAFSTSNVLHSIDRASGRIRRQPPMAHASVNAAATHSTLAVNVSIGGQHIVVPQLLENRQANNVGGVEFQGRNAVLDFQRHSSVMDVQRDNAVVNQTWVPLLAGPLQDRQLSLPWALTTSAQGGITSAVGLVGLSLVLATSIAQNWSSTDAVGFAAAACITAVNMVLLLVVVSLTHGLRSYSSKPAQPYSTGRDRSVAGWSIGQPLKNLVGLAAVPGQASWLSLSRTTNDAEATTSSSHAVLSLVAAQTSVRQYSVSCVSKLEPFTQALSFARRLPKGNADDVKSKIRGSRIGIF